MNRALRQILLDRHFSLERMFRGGPTGFDFTDLDINRRYTADQQALIYVDGVGTLLVSNGQQCQVLLDKSQGFAVGPELIVGGDFASGAGFSLDTGWTISGGVATHASSASGGDIIGNALGNVVGETYRGSFDVTAYTSGQASLKSPIQTSSTAAAGLGTHARYGVSTVAGQTGRITTVVNTSVLSVDNFSFKKCPGTNSATQTTSGARPTWQPNSGQPYLSFDGSDDAMTTSLLPAASMTICVGFRANSTGANQCLVGAQTAAANNDRCMLGVNSSGVLSGAWGSTGLGSTISGGGSIVGSDAVGLLRGNSELVELWLNGQRVYQGPPAGNSPANNTTVPFMIGADNGNGSAAFFMSGRWHGGVAVNKFIGDGDVLPLMRLHGDLVGLKF